MKVTLSSETEHNCEDKPKMTIELRRVFNLLRPKELLLLLIEVLVLVLGCYQARLVWGMFFAPVLPFWHFLPYSKILTVEVQIVKYEFHRRVGRRYGRGLRYVRWEVGGRPETVEFRQNIIEKIFNAGHIRFVEVGTSRKRSVYGITNFDETKQKIERVFKMYHF